MLDYLIIDSKLSTVDKCSEYFLNQIKKLTAQYNERKELSQKMFRNNS